MTRIILLFVLLSSLLISGCGQAPVPASTLSSPAPASEWTTRMTHSGGIMGLSRSIEISSDGKFTVVDNRTNKTVTRELSTDKLSTLNELMTAVEYNPAGKPDGTGCADCFVYDLEVRRDGERFAVQLNDISLPNSGFESLVNFLREMIDTALN